MLEDYSGSWELALFGKDHEAFMSYMKPKETLFLEGEIGEKFFLKPEDRAQGKTSPYTFKLKKTGIETMSATLTNWGTVTADEETVVIQ